MAFPPRPMAGLALVAARAAEAPTVAVKIAPWMSANLNVALVRSDPLKLANLNWT